MNVLVYTGPETLQSSVSRTITSLRSALYPNYTVQPVTLQSLTSHPWTASCALLVFPACRDHLSLSSTAQASIRSYVENGGAFLGLRAGAKCGGTLLGSGDYSLRFQSRAGPTVYCSFLPGGDEQTHKISIVAEDGTAVNSVLASGVAGFEAVESSRAARIMARDAENNTVVAVQFEVGAGKLALWGLQLEVTIVAEDSASEVRVAEERRRDVLNKTLASLGLQLPTPLGSEPTHPLPQLLVAAPSRPDVVTRVLGSLNVKLPATYKDTSDTFAFHDASEAETLLQQYRVTAPPDNTRHVIVYENGVLPSTAFTPLFNVQQFFEDLKITRARAQQATSELWGVGEALFYGEVVTSTQTLLDKYISSVLELRPRSDN